MSDRDKTDQQVHDLLDEANEILLAMALPGAKDLGKVTDLIVRMRDCAEQARAVGKSKCVQHLREVVNMLEKESTKKPPLSN